MKALFFFIRALHDACHTVLLEASGKKAGRYSSLYTGLKDALVQDTLRVYAGGDDCMEIEDFRPQLDLSPIKPLYVDARHAWALRTFLRCEFVPSGWDDNSMTTGTSRGSSRARADFLAPALYVRPGHWGVSWMLATPPRVDLMVIGERTAAVAYQIGHEGGSARLRKENGRWWLLGGSLSWTE